MLVMRQARTWEGHFCRTCSKSFFWKASIHTFFLGWWGTISLVLTPIFLIGNIANVVRTLSMPKAEALNRSALAAKREYAVAMLATKSRATVIDVLAKDTGATPDEVETFLNEIEPGRATG
jgi:hypothetical protein